MPSHHTPLNDGPMVSENQRAETTLRQFFLQDNKTDHGLLVTGPSGSGKTTLVRRVALETDVQLLDLSPTELANDSAGEVEQYVHSAFLTKETSTSRRFTRVCIFIDNLDLWAPPQGTFSSPLQTRLVASLSDNITVLPEYPSHNRPCFVATATSKAFVHPTLVRPNAISVIVKLAPLSHIERELWCYKPLLKLFSSDHDSNKDETLKACAQQVAKVTPGFLHSDMSRLFASLAHYRTQNPQSFPTSTEFINSHVLSYAAREFTPALLSQMSPLLTLLPTYTSYGALPVQGLKAQIKLLTQCIHAVFSVARQDALKHCPQETLTALQNLRPPAAIIIHGPSGCGKSALVRQVSDFLPPHAVNVMPIDSSSIVSAVIGQAERNLTTVFETARDIAPTVLIIDNIDILAPPRHQLEQSGSSSMAEAFTRLLSTLLVQIDGVRQGPEREAPILIIATTRSLSLIDSALLRPGRFDVHISVDFPDPQARWEILESFLKRVPTFATHIDEVDKEAFKQKSRGWTGADVIGYARQLALSWANVVADVL